MERLTKWNGKKWVLPQGRTSDGESYWRIIAERLAAYENTGLNPDEIINSRRVGKMLKDMKPRERITEDLYEIRFFGGENGGFAFPCDKDGNLFPMTEAAKENYEWCMANPAEFGYCWNRKVHYQCTYTQEASGTCECGAVVKLRNQYLGACECENCGRWYNLFGQELKNPEYWGED